MTKDNESDENVFFDLVDILRVIWKWKFIILAGTLVFAVITAVISINSEKVYRVEMTISPGILSISEQGKTIHIDSAANISAMINTGTFDGKILEYLKNDNLDNLPELFHFETYIPKGSETIKIAYETSNTNIRIKTLNYLVDCLAELYENLVLHYKKKYKMEMDEINSNINDLKLRKNSEYKNIENINSRRAELKKEIEFIAANTKKLSQERQTFISSNTQEDNILQALLYSNTIQQNLTLTNTYKGELNTLLQEREKILQTISDFDKNISTAMIKIENIAFNKDIIKNIHVIQQPTFGPKPVKPKIKLRILLAIIAGLFFMIFLAFLIEYTSNLKKNKSVNQIK
jgi:LPS O-antigen subunit length determinant protein (WzzB/FepE family)